MEDQDIQLAPEKPEDQTVVDLGEAEKPTVRIEPVAKEPEPAPEDEREKAIADLKAQLDQANQARENERQHRERVEQFAREQAARAQNAEVGIQDSQLRTIVNAIDATEQSAINAQRSYADAMGVGDYEAAAKAQRAMAQAEAQLLQLNQGKRALENELSTRQTEGRVKEPAPQFQPAPVQRDPVEELAARLSPKSAGWLRLHPQAASNVDKLTAAHSAAVNLEGIAVESPEYFAFIEEKLGFSPSKSAAQTERSTRSAMTAAPVTTTGGSSPSKSATSMILSPSEVEMALLLEPDLPRDKALERYARNKAALAREGKLSA
jgi:hypothetical protein